MSPSRIDPAMLAYIRTGAYMTTLPPSSHERPELSAPKWPTDVDLADNLAAHFASAMPSRSAAIIDLAQPSSAGSVLAGVGGH